MRIYRNYMQPKYCTVFYLLWYLEVSGVKKGPLFQKMKMVELEDELFEPHPGRRRTGSARRTMIMVRHVYVIRNCTFIFKHIHLNMFISSLPTPTPLLPNPCMARYWHLVGS